MHKEHAIMPESKTFKQTNRRSIYVTNTQFKIRVNLDLLVKIQMQ